MALLLQRLEGASQMEQARAINIMTRRRSYLVPTNAPHQRSTGWANNAAVAAERHRVFGAVIGRPSNGFGWPSVEQLLYEDDHAIPPEVGAHLPMQAAQYVECVRPLFLASAEVFLVDTYFMLRTTSGERDRQRWQVLVAFLKLAEEARTCEVLRLILARA